MDGRKIFCRRLKEEFIFQSKVIRSVVDWTIFLYMVFPVLIILPFIYLEMWEDIHLYWNGEIPFYILLGLLLLILLRGNFRTFLFEADALFLLRHQELYQNLKLWSFHYSFIQLVISTGLLLVLVLPILYEVYGFTEIELLILFIVLTSYRLFIATIKKLMNRPLNRWIIIFMIYGFFIYIILQVHVVIVITINVISLLTIYFVHRVHFVRSKKYFLKEIVIEKSERIRYIKLIFTFSPDVETPIVHKASRPNLFRKSNKIFRESTKENGLLELLVKGFLRNKVFISSYSQMIGISIFAISLLPVWGKWVIFFVFIFFINSWLKSLYHLMLNQAFFEIVTFDKKIIPLVWPRFRIWLALPPIFIVGGLVLFFSIFP